MFLILKREGTFNINLDFAETNFRKKSNGENVNIWVAMTSVEVLNCTDKGHIFLNSVLEEFL